MQKRRLPLPLAPFVLGPWFSQKQGLQGLPSLSHAGHRSRRSVGAVGPVGQRCSKSVQREVRAFNSSREKYCKWHTTPSLTHPSTAQPPPPQSLHSELFSRLIPPHSFGGISFLLSSTFYTFFIPVARFSTLAPAVLLLSEQPHHASIPRSPSNPNFNASENESRIFASRVY